MFLPMLDAPSSSSSVPMFATPDFGGFSQILEKHMREIKAEPSATVTQEIDLSHKDKVNIWTVFLSVSLSIWLWKHV